MYLKTLFHPFLVLCALIMSIGLRPTSAPAETSCKAIQQQTGFYYTVKKGDTLWDLSRKFYDSPFAWPGLWEDNKQMPNPHWIYPGQRLRLYLKEEPYKTREAAASPALRPFSSALLSDDIKPYYHYSEIRQIDFIRKEAVAPSGHIFKGLSGRSMIAQDDIVYLAQDGNSPLTPGARFYVYHTSPFSIETQGKSKFLHQKIGIRHDIVGVVKVTRREADYAVGTIERAYTNIQVNNLLMPYVERSADINLLDGIKGLSGTIVGTEEGHCILGNESLVFVDKGQDNGVKPGQTYSIYIQDTAKKTPADRETISLAPVDIGTILILHAEPAFATALVIQADKDIYPGAGFRAL